MYLCSSKQSTMRLLQKCFQWMLLLLLFAACEEFDDGGLRYQSRKNIIGTWQFNEVITNSQPIPTALFDSIYAHTTIEFEKGSMVTFLWKNQYDSLLQTQMANYVFNHNKQLLRITFESYPTVNQSYFVKRLTKDEFWMEFYNDDDYCKWRLKKIDN